MEYANDHVCFLYDITYKVYAYPDNRKYKFCPNPLNRGIYKDVALAKHSFLVDITLGVDLYSTLRPCNSCSMAKFRVDCLAYTHSRARPVPSLTSPGNGLPPSATIPVERLISNECPSLSNSGLWKRDVQYALTTRSQRALLTEPRVRLFLLLFHEFS